MPSVYCPLAPTLRSACEALRYRRGQRALHPRLAHLPNTANAKPGCHPGLSDSTRVGTSFFVFLELHFCSSTAIAELVSGELLGATGLDQTKHPA